MRTLRLGSTGPAVQLLQKALNRAGFGPLALDGLFGPATGEALRRFQREQRIAVDGVAGPETHRALRPWYTGALYAVLRRGDTFYSLAQRWGTTVEAIQTANPGLSPENLPVGGTVTVPLPFPVVPADIDWFAELIELCAEGLHARYPFLGTGVIGRSVLGRPLRSLSVGEGPLRVLYTAEHHANEWITTPLLFTFAEQLCAAAAIGGDIGGQSAAGLLAGASLWMIPAVNPDGLELVTGELTGGAAFERARRIAAAYPRYAFPRGWKANICGVDLNLQYPAGWEQARAIKFAAGIVSPAPADFVGATPLAAPEARALYDFTRQLDPARVFAWHTQGGVIYWRFRNAAPPESQALVERFAAVSGYTPMDTPYAADFAGFKDWFIQDYERPGFTIEAGRGVNPLPLSDFETLWRENLGIFVEGMKATEESP